MNIFGGTDSSYKWLKWRKPNLKMFHVAKMFRRHACTPPSIIVGVTNSLSSEIRKLEIVDEHLLRSLVHGQSKLPLEFLYLEAGAITIRFLISSRRLMYLQTILKRDNDELVKIIFNAHKSDPCP